MKRIMFLLMAVSATCMLLSCSKDDEDDARYYVKYEVTFTTQHINATRNIYVDTDKGPQYISLEGTGKSLTWERVYGPVDKNFLAAMTCALDNYPYPSSIHGLIWVSRDKEPFVIKAEDTQEKSISLKYKIDF